MQHDGGDGNGLSDKVNHHFLLNSNRYSKYSRTMSESYRFLKIFEDFLDEQLKHYWRYIRIDIT